MKKSALLLVAVCLLLGAAPGSPRIQLLPVWEAPLPALSRWAQDIRWASDQEFFLSGGREGVHRYRIAQNLAPPVLEIAGGNPPNGFFFSSRLAASDKYLVAASPFSGLAWKKRGSNRSTSVDGANHFSVIVDVDVYQDKLLILGANRDSTGEWAPEGGIAWFGTLSRNLTDLHPVLYSTSGPGAMPMAKCHLMELGAVRFLRDGSFVIVPGVEPGVFLYDASGKLKRTWNTARMEFEDRCRLDDREFTAYAANGNSRTAWSNQHTVLDDVVPIGDRIGLILRSRRESTTSWTLALLDRNGEARRISLPITSPSPWSHLRADVRGDLILCLVSEYGDLNRPPTAIPRIVTVRFAER